MSSYLQKNHRTEKILEIAKEAGNAIMKVYERDFEVKIKSDNSPLTNADLASNQIICERLKQLDLNIPILSEESKQVTFSERSKWKRYWLIDPLDGTKEFLKRNDEFTVNIALIENQNPIFGVVYAPALDQLYWGGVNFGSFQINKSIEKKLIIKKNNPSDPLRIVTSRSHPSEEIKKLLNMMKSYELVEIGSSLKFCFIANSEADIYPRLGPTSEWDTAAGQAVAVYAGAKIADIYNNPLTYNTKERLINPHFIVANSKKNLNMILSLL